MADIELSSYVTGLASATLTGTEEVYLVGDEKTTTQDIADLGNSNIRVWKAQISQTGTSAPTLTTLIDDFGLTLSTNYILTGAYSINGFGGILTGLIDVNITTRNYGTDTADVYVATSSVLGIATFSSGASANGVLDNSGFNLGTSVITVIKYD